MPAWWIVALIYLALTVGYELLRPKPKFDEPKPSSLGDFRFPTIGEGRVVPIVWGTCKVAGPIIAWYGNLVVEAIKKKVKTGLFSSENITTGYRYYLGIQAVFCSGEIDEVIEIRFDDKVPAQSISLMGDITNVSINDQEIFGGEESEGGLQGDVYMYRGTMTQDPDDYLESVIGDDLPAWRGICYGVCRAMYLGMSPYIKPIAAVLRRCPNSLGLTGGHENIDGDANPAAMIYELLTSPPASNGLGISPGLLDIASFQDVGDTLADEGLGLSMIQDRAASAKDVILEILRHIDAVIYVEPSTGVLVLKLIRRDYSPGGLPILDENNCTVESFARPSWSELKNTIRVSYVDRTDGYTEKIAQSQDLAGIEIQDGEVSVQEISLRGISNATNAQLASARGLAALGYPLATLLIKADRTAWGFRPGTPFKINWMPLGITGMICRAVRIGTGNLSSGKIDIEAIEDVFGIQWTAYTLPPPTGWTEPLTDVAALTAQVALPAPYEAVREYGSQGDDVQLAVVMAARGVTGVSTGYKVYVKAGTGCYPPKSIPFFTPSGTLNSAIDELSTEVIVAVGPDITRVLSVGAPDFASGSNVAWLKHASGLEEFIAFQDVVAGSGIVTLQTIARGCLDTAPTAFAAGTRVWFMSYGSDAVNVPAPAISPPNTLRFQPYNNRSEYPFGSSLDSTCVASDPARANRVYCPTAVEFNGVAYPENITGELTVSWSHRNRLGIWSYVDSGATVDPETDTEYDILVYGELGTLVHTETGLTGTSWTYLEATEIAESGLGRLNNHLRIIVRTYGDSRAHQGYREIEWEFDRV